MGGGVFQGVILGLVVSGVVLAGLSLSTPLPDRPDGAAVAAVAADDGAELAPPGQDPAADPTSEPDLVADPAPATSTDAPATSAEAPEAAASPAAPAEEPAPARGPGSTVPALPGPALPGDRTSADLSSPGGTSPGSLARPAPPILPDDANAQGPRPLLAPLPAAPGAIALSGGDAAEPGGPTPLASLQPAPDRQQLPRQGPAASTTPLPPPAPGRDPMPGALGTATLAAPLAAVRPAAPDAAAPGANPPVLSRPSDPQAAGVVPRRLATPLPEIEPAQSTDTAPSPASGHGAGTGSVAGLAPTATADLSPTPPVGSLSPLPETGTAPGGPSLASPGLAPAEAGRDPVPENPPEPNALRDNAVAFDAGPQTPLLAIVLIDVPGGLPDLATIQDVGFPLTVAIDPMRPDAAARAATLGAAGLEVVMLGAPVVPEGAAPDDVAAALAGAQSRLPQSVALMDAPDGRMEADRAMLEATMAALAQTGHGWLAWSRGIDAHAGVAGRGGVPTAMVLRAIDDAGQRAPEIARDLDRAAFEAAREGAIIVVGHARPDTLTALFSWAQRAQGMGTAPGGLAGGVALAPVSAVLLRVEP